MITWHMNMKFLFFTEKMKLFQANQFFLCKVEHCQASPGKKKTCVLFCKMIDTIQYDLYEECMKQLTDKTVEVGEGYHCF